MDKSNIQESVNKYITLRPQYEQLGEKVSAIIKEVLEINDVNYHVISHRAKEIDSFSKKIENPKYNDPFNQITDLAGIRVIAYVEDDVDEINKSIEELFSIDKPNSSNKSDDLGEDKVGYKSVHYICQLPATRCELPEYSRFKDLKFEIQTRTILQHSWAEIEHDRNYKFSGELPKEIKRRFKLLAGTLEIIDREFNQLSKEIDSYGKEVTEKTAKGDLDIALNSTSLKNYIAIKFKEQINNGILDINRNNGFENNIIINELTDFGINTIQDIDQIIPKDFVDKIKEPSTIIGLLRRVMYVNDYKKYFKNSFKSGWVLIKNQAVVKKLLEDYNISYEDFYKEHKKALNRLK